MLLNYYIGRFVLGLLCVGVCVRFGCGGIRVQQGSRIILKMGILMPETC